MERFPVNFGSELAGKSFEDIFENHPKWVACVEFSWTDSCSGLFDRFRTYILERLSDPASRTSHEDRCRTYVSTLTIKKIPEYLLKYKC